MNYNQAIDIYCERMGPEFWAEPLNALTNGAFFIAALASFFHARRTGTLDLKVWILIVLLLAIGTGSFLFHTLATRWAMLADVLPILFYQLAFLSLYARDAMRCGPKGTGLLLGGFIGCGYLAENLPADWLNGSLSYAPALLFVSGLGFWHMRNLNTERCALIAAAGIFLASLCFRTLDMAVCQAFAPGSHFLWHILNALVLYLTVRAYCAARQSLAHHY